MRTIGTTDHYAIHPRGSRCVTFDGSMSTKEYDRADVCDCDMQSRKRGQRGVHATTHDDRCSNAIRTLSVA